MISLLQALVEHFARHPQLLPDDVAADPDGAAVLHESVAYVGGMTDRFACRQAVALLGWDTARLPQGIDTHL